LFKVLLKPLAYKKLVSRQLIVAAIAFPNSKAVYTITVVGDCFSRDL